MSFMKLPSEIRMRIYAYVIDEPITMELDWRPTPELRAGDSVQLGDVFYDEDLYREGIDWTRFSKEARYRTRQKKQGSSIKCWKNARVGYNLLWVNRVISREASPSFLANITFSFTAYSCLVHYVAVWRSHGTIKFIRNLRLVLDVWNNESWGPDTLEDNLWMLKEYGLQTAFSGLRTLHIEFSILTSRLRGFAYYIMEHHADDGDQHRNHVRNALYYLQSHFADTDSLKIKVTGLGSRKLAQYFAEVVHGWQLFDDFNFDAAATKKAIESAS